MRIIKIVFLAAVTNLFNCYAQTNNINSDQVEKLISRHINESGGNVALMEMKSISRYGLIEFYNEDKSTDSYCYQTNIVYPTKLREQIKGEEILHEKGTDGILYWLWNGSQHEFTTDNEEMDYMNGTAERANREMLWVKKELQNYTTASSPSWAPKQSQCIQEINSRKNYCFDSITGLLNALGTDEEFRKVSDWRNVGNIKIPFHLVHYKNSGIMYEIQLKHAVLNTKIPDRQFTKPDLPKTACYSAEFE